MCKPNKRGGEIRFKMKEFKERVRFDKEIREAING